MNTLSRFELELFNQAVTFEDRVIALNQPAVSIPTQAVQDIIEVSNDQGCEQ
jgi:hypothetical protein